MKRLSILLALTATFAVTPPAVASCAPFPDLACNYVAIPQSACFTVVNDPRVPAPVSGPVRGAAICEKLPKNGVATAQDANIFSLGQSMVVPNSGISVGVQRRIFVHNLDTALVHTFSDPGCLDTSTSTPCRFNVSMNVGDFGQFAKSVTITSSIFNRPDDTYDFKCRWHAGESGTFTVVD